MANYEYIDSGYDDGAIFGATSAKKIAFFGGTPVAKTAITLTSTAGTTTPATIAADLVALHAQLQTLGLI